MSARPRQDGMARAFVLRPSESPRQALWRLRQDKVARVVNELGSLNSLQHMSFRMPCVTLGRWSLSARRHCAIELLLVLVRPHGHSAVPAGTSTKTAS